MIDRAKLKHDMECGSATCLAAWCEVLLRELDDREAIYLPCLLTIARYGEPASAQSASKAIDRLRTAQCQSEHVRQIKEGIA